MYPAALTVERRNSLAARLDGAEIGTLGISFA
jgi:hypothetical protein